MRRSKEEVERIWKRYRRHRDQEVKGLLAEQYLGVVYKLAGKMEKRTPYNVTFEDLASAGTFGLLEAIDRFDPKRGVQFQSYCAGRIQGSMLDYLRSLDYVPRLARSRSNRMQEAYCALEKEYERPPTDLELAKKMRMSVKRLDRLYGELRGAWPVELHRRKLEKDPTLFGMELMEDSKSTGPARRSQGRDMMRFLRAKLSPREGFVIMMYYVEELTLKEIATVMGVSESRICQLQMKAVRRLKNVLKRPSTSVA